MTPNEVMAELLTRVAAGKGEAVTVGQVEVARWPAEAAAALRRQGLITVAKPAGSIECPGCEEACTMPVETRTGAGRTALFIMCDKRDDISRVTVKPEALARWRCSPRHLGQFVAEQAGLHQKVSMAEGTNLLQIGIANGKKRNQMLGLRVEKVVTLTAGDKWMPLIELLAFGEGKYALDVGRVLGLVDASTTRDERYTTTTDRRAEQKKRTEEMRERWRREHRSLMKKKPGMSDVWYSRQIAKSPAGAGRDSETIRKHMKE